jgi:alpha-tubulin suppressor-like RCC1 family protein
MRNIIPSATSVLFVTSLLVSACDGLQGGSPVSVPSEFRYDGIGQLVQNKEGSYTVVWPAVPFDGVKYKVFSRVKSADMDWNKFQVSEFTSIVTDDMRFSESTCFVVRFFTPTIDSDKNAKELCTDGFNYTFPGIKSLNRESSGVYSVAWDAAPIPGVGYKVFEVDANGAVLQDTVKEVDGLRTSVGPFPLGAIKCFVVRAHADGIPEFDTNSKSLCTEDNRLTKFIGIEAIQSKMRGQVQISWTIDENPDVVGYIIYRGSDFRETYAKVDSRLQSNIVIDNLEPFSNVVFGVRALTSYGSEDANTRTAGVQVYSRTPPAFAGVSKAELESANRVRISWESVPNVSSYLLYTKRSSKGVEPNFDFATPDVEIPANLPPVHIISGLGDDERYSFVVRAVSTFGVADKNETIAFVETPDAGPPRFAGIKSAVVKDGKVVLNWDRPTGQVTQFRIYMAKGSASAIDTNATNIPPEPATATTAVVSGFQNGADYSFLVRAEDRFGNVDSNLTTATVTAASQSLPVFFGYIGAQGIDERRIEPEFRVTPDANITSYTIDVRPVGQATFSERYYVPQDLTKSSIKFMIANLISDKEYEFLIRSVDRWGNSSNNTSTIKGKTLDNTPPVFAGIGNVVQPAGKSELTVSWPPSSTRDISYYKVYYSLEPLADRSFSQRAPIPVSINVSPAITADKSEFVFDTLVKGANYYFVVRAFDLYDNEDSNRTQMNAVVQNTFPSLGFDTSAIATPEGVLGAPITITASDPDLADTLVFSLDSSSTCNLTAAPILFEPFARVGKQRKAVINWRPPFGYIPAGRSTQSCTLAYTVNDGQSNSPPIVLTLTAVNRPPFNVTAVIAPAPNPTLGYLRNGSLSCSGSADDDDGNFPTYLYKWVKNDVEIPGATQSTLSPATAQYLPSDVIRCMVTADDEHDPVSQLSAPVTMGNVAPDLLSAFLTKESGALPIRVDDTVSCAWSARDQDGDSVSFGQLTLQASLDGGVTWSDPELPSVTCPIAEQNKRCFTVNASVRRAKLRCTVASATDGFITVSVPFSSSSRDVGNSTPTLTGVNLSSSTQVSQIGTTLTCGLTVADRDNDALVLPPQIRWYRNGALVAGANAVTYTVSIADRGVPVLCEVTIPTNADGFGSAQVGPLRSTSMTYLNSDPRVNSVTVSPSLAVTGTALTCNYNITDPDGDVVLTGSNYLRIKWYSDDGSFRSEIVGEISDSYFARAIDRGRKISCEVSVLGNADGAGSAPLVPVFSSNETIPSNSAPVITSVTLAASADPARTGTTLSCSYTYSDLDSDNLVASPTFSWTADGVSISGASSATYSVVRVNRGKAIRCRVGLPPDSDGKGSAAIAPVTSTNSIVPVNTDPEIIGVTVNAVSSAPFYPGTELSCNASTIRDQDNDPLTPYYRWYRAGLEIAGAATYSYIATFLDRGENITCAIGLAANADGGGSSAILVASSNQFAISNRAPTNTFQAILSVSGGGLAYRTSSVNCALPSAGSLPSPLDPDGDPVTYRYVWKVGTGFLTGTDGNGTSSGANMDLTGKVVANDQVTCQILLSDGVATSLSAASAATSISNRAPFMVGVPTIGPATIYDSSVTPTLTCTPPGVISDPDGDALTIRYRFSKRFWDNVSAFSSTRYDIDGGFGLNAASWGPANVITTDHPGTSIVWRAGANIVGCDIEVTDTFGASVQQSASEIVVTNSVPTGSFSCNGGVSTVVANAGAALPQTTSCDGSGLSDADGHVLSYVSDSAATTCSGVGSSILINPVTGVVSGTAPGAECIVSIVVQDTYGALAQVGGVTSRFNITLRIPFSSSLGAPYVDGTCTLRQPASFIPIAETYSSSSVNLSALALGPHVYSNPGTPAGVISSPLNPANGGGNIALTWAATSSGGSTNTLSRTIVIADSPAGGTRSNGALRQAGIQPLPSEVSDGASGTKSANCSLASCSPASKAGSLAAGSNFGCALAEDGRLFCWGDNGKGQLGRGSLATAERPQYGNPAAFLNSPATEVDLGSLRATAVAANGNIVLDAHQACAVMVDPNSGNANRGVYCWGDNYYGQLGRSTYSTAPRGSGVPQQVTGLSGGTSTDAVTAVTVGGGHACALMGAAVPAGGGAVKCWGLNDRGQVGDGTRVSSALPVAVQQFETAGALAIAAGLKHTCAITNVGRVKCWGDNARSQLGFDSPNPSERWSVVPVEVVGLGDDVIGLAAGAEHTCALKQTGAVRCWGSISDGQVGDGNIGFAQIGPAPLNGAIVTGALAIAAGGGHTCALLENGGMKCWGRNSSRQLGAGLALSVSSVPVDVLSLSNAGMAVSAGENFTCVLTNDSKVKCFGDNSSFQLGLDLAQVKPENPAMPNSNITPVAPLPALRQCRELRAYVP